MVRWHVAGVVRALTGALDCMAGAIIGFLALPKPILKADFGVVRSFLKKIVATASTDGERLQASFGVKFEGPRVLRVTHLPRDPGRSDVEMFLEPSKSPLLTDGDDQTLQGLLKSTRSLVEAVAEELIRGWTWRRTHPDSPAQPAEQWPNGTSIESIRFSGYAPRSFEYSPSMMMHRVVSPRMRAAATDDESRPQWKTFD